MTPVKPGAYLFRKESIAELRQRLSLSQAAMAARIGVPKNTVSRWETGETTPDAQSLAAIYSLGMEVGIVATFFAPVKQKAPVRDAALVYWDVPTNSGWHAIEPQSASIIEEVKRRVPHATRQLVKAFVGRNDSMLTNTLENLGWRVWATTSLTGFTDWNEEIYDQALSDAGQNPVGSVVFLVTADVRHVGLIQELRERDVRVYLVTQQRAGLLVPEVSPQLIEAVGKRRWIEFPNQSGITVRSISAPRRPRVWRRTARPSC